MRRQRSFGEVVPGARKDEERTAGKRSRVCPRCSATTLCTSFALSLAFLSLVTEVTVEEEGQKTFDSEIKVTRTNELWTVRDADKYVACAAASKDFPGPVPENETTGYLVIAASGGLNQERTGITDAVVVARMLNATLVVPQLDHASYWADQSNFEDIFDRAHFIDSLARDVRVVPTLPPKYLNAEIPEKRVPRKSTERYYINKVLPLLKAKKVLRLTKFDFRLANRVPRELQKLRCRAAFRALRFTRPIRALGERLLERMRATGGGPFVAVHLRFEKDMLAFSGCQYGGGQREAEEFAETRKRWKNLRALNPDEERRKGKCPLSPHEVGLLLRALGYGSSTRLYVASGNIYGGEATMAALSAMFPLISSKETLLTKDEIAPFANFSSRLAALDYAVALASDVFVANNRGNMARLLAGHRRFLGHKKTIRPNAKKLAAIMMARHNMTEMAFAEKVERVQKGFMGEPLLTAPRRDQFLENPFVCICETGASRRARLAYTQDREQRATLDSEKAKESTGNNGVKEGPLHAAEVVEEEEGDGNGWEDMDRWAGGGEEDDGR